MKSKSTTGAGKAVGPTTSSYTKQTTDKVIAKAAAKSPSKKPATAVAVKKSKSDTVTKPKKNGKPKKVKMVRDSYTMPENDYAKLAELKKTCLKAGVHVKKSELLRAGLAALAKLPTATLLKTVERLEKIKTGRPGKH